jgi:hypothetical protein
MAFSRSLCPDKISQSNRDTPSHLVKSLDELSLIIVDFFSGNAHPQDILRRLVAYEGPDTEKANEYLAPLYLAFGDIEKAKQAFHESLAFSNDKEGTLNLVRQIGFYQFFIDLVQSIAISPDNFNLIHALLFHLEGVALWRLDPVHQFLLRLLDYPQLPETSRSLAASLHVHSSAFQQLKAETDLQNIDELIEQIIATPDSQLTKLINAYFLLEASSARPAKRHKLLTTRKQLPTIGQNFFYWCFDNVVESPHDLASHAPLFGNLQTEGLTNRIYIAAILLIHGPKLLASTDIYTYIGVMRFIFPLGPCIEMLEQIINSDTSFTADQAVVVGHQLLECSRQHNLFASPRKSAIASPPSSVGSLRTIVLCSGQARGFRETLPTILSNIVSPLNADFIISLWKDPGFPKGSHANRLTRMVPREFAPLNESGLLTDTVFREHFPCTYQALIPDNISVIDEVTHICSTHPFNIQRKNLNAWATLDVEDEAAVEADACARTGFQHSTEGCNQFKMFYKFARLASLLRARESFSGFYDRVIWVRPDFHVLELDPVLIAKAQHYYYTSFGAPSACGDYLLIGDRAMIDLMADAYLQGDIYNHFSVLDPYHRNYTGKIYFGGPELLARKFYQHGRSFLTLGPNELRHAGLRAYSISPELFAKSFLQEFKADGYKISPSEAAILDQMRSSSRNILSVSE